MIRLAIPSSTSWPSTMIRSRSSRSKTVSSRVVTVVFDMSPTVGGKPQVGARFRGEANVRPGRTPGRPFGAT